MELTCEGKTHPALGCDDALEALGPRQVQKNARVMRVILNDQQGGVALHHLVAIILDVLFAGDWQNAAVYGTVEGVQISISDQATLNDGGTPLNLWQRNMFAVRAEIEVGFRVRDVNAFVSINDGTAD